MPSKRGTRSKKLRSLQRKKVAAAKAAAGAPAAAAASPTADGTVAIAAQQTVPEGEATSPFATTSVAPPPVDETEMAETEVEILMEGRVGVPHIDFLGSSAQVLHSEVEARLARPGGAGVLTLESFINDHDAALMEKAAERFNEDNTVPIFNSQPVSKMQGPGADLNRRQAVMKATWAATRALVVVARLDRLCDLMFYVYGRRYVASEPKILVSLPGAERQMPHGDDAEKKDVGTPPRTLGVVMAFYDTAFLDTWPRRFCDDSTNGELMSAVYRSEVERVHVKKGSIILFRGDTIHRGVEIMSADDLYRRVHAYLWLADEPISTEWRDKTYPAKEVID